MSLALAVAVAVVAAAAVAAVVVVVGWGWGWGVTGDKKYDKQEHPESALYHIYPFSEIFIDFFHAYIAIKIWKPLFRYLVHCNVVVHATFLASYKSIG